MPLTFDQITQPQMNASLSANSASLNTAIEEKSILKTSTTNSSLLLSEVYNEYNVTQNVFVASTTLLALLVVVAAGMLFGFPLLWPLAITLMLCAFLVDGYYFLLLFTVFLFVKIISLKMSGAI